MVDCFTLSYTSILLCSLLILLLFGRGTDTNYHEEYVGLTYRNIHKVFKEAVNTPLPKGTTPPLKETTPPTANTPASKVTTPTPKANVNGKSLWDYLVDGPNGDRSKVVLYSPNPWGGFGNSFRGLRGMCVYALLKGAKIRGIFGKEVL